MTSFMASLSGEGVIPGELEWAGEWPPSMLWCKTELTSRVTW